MQDEIGLDAQSSNEHVIPTSNGIGIISALTPCIDNGDNVYFDDGCVMRLPDKNVPLGITSRGASPTFYCFKLGISVKKIT